MPTETPRPIQPTEAQPRIVPQEMSGMRDEWLQTLSRIPGDGLKGKGFPRNVLGSIMHDPRTFGPFLEYWVTCKSAMGLTVREQELVILRMACLFASNYVWKHHVPVAREFGVTQEEIEAVRAGCYSALASSREQSLLVLTDELVEQRTVTAQAWAEHGATLPAGDMVDLVSLVSQYVFFALMNNALQVPVEPELDEVPSL